MEKATPEAPEGWALSELPDGRWQLRCDAAFNAYHIAHFKGLGWQAWLKGEPVSGYRPGKLAEVLPELIQDLLSDEVEDTIVAPKPRVGFSSKNDNLRAVRHKRWAAGIEAALNQPVTEVKSKVRKRLPAQSAQAHKTVETNPAEQEPKKCPST